MLTLTVVQASAWLNASKGPIHGNDKKGDTFWKEVTDTFNKKGEGKHRREIKPIEGSLVTA
jgi:hypothetical protein